MTCFFSLKFSCLYSLWGVAFSPLFEQKGLKMRTHRCADVTEELLKQKVSLCGWVHHRRDHGGVIFIDLRDISGLVQVVFEPELQAMFEEAESLRHEFVIHVNGLVRARPEGMINPNMNTGKIEVLADSLTILNTAKTPPILPDENQNVGEEARLKHRYIDLRRHHMQKNLILRHKLNQAIREFLNQEDFIDIETPMLTKATPEGARDFLVPSRLHQGEFYALPQSPQLFKQLLMMAGFDKYYQIVKCFRDEDLRADRQPEFTQLDIETTFLDEDAIQDIIERLIVNLFDKVLNVEIERPFKRMSYAEVMKRYGSDKPDLRNPLELVDVADLVKDVDFNVFAKPAKDEGSRVVALKLPNGCELSRKELDDYGKYVGRYGAKGLAYIKVNELAKGIEGLQSPIIKFLPEDVVLNILKRLKAVDGDVVFFGADKVNIVNDAMGALRDKLGADRNLIKEGWSLLWVVDWPMFERDEKGEYQALHHPFTAPAENDIDLLSSAPEKALSRAYDVVLNGYEIGGGSVRIHSEEVQNQVFRVLGIDEKTANDKFGFLLDALKYGCPPHGGIAFGIDRIAMLFAGENSIREVIAFPKTQSGSCPLTEAPARVSRMQLNELGVEVKNKD